MKSQTDAGENAGRQPQALITDLAAKDQPVLPLAIAFRISLRGIRSRLGRSLVTLFGVALGIAFLMTVLAGFHVKKALASDKERIRTVERMVSMLRAEIGILKGRRFVVFAEKIGDIELAFVKALKKKDAEVIARGKFETESVQLEPSGRAADDAGVDGFVLLNGASAFTSAYPASSTNVKVILFEDDKKAVESLEEDGWTAKMLPVALKLEELQRVAKKETEERYRMYWILTVSLLITVGGISNSMLMSVTERFREIGTMKCLGALSSFVVKMFLIESSFVGLVGSLGGALIGLLFTLAAYGNVYGFVRVLTAVSPALLFYRLVLCLGTGVILSIVAAIYPARIAAKMIPAVALSTNV